ncbi:MAG: DnaD domain-containing protein [Bacilli bacterium]|nr:DnaD domain protein [Bacilli bacterium]
MSNKILEGLIKEKDYNLKKLLFKIVKDFDLNVNEFMLLIYFMNQDCPILDVNDIHNVTFMEPKIILQSFKALSIKGLISTKVTPVKDKISETIDLTNVYRAMVSDINYDIKKKSEKNIFEVFEKEFGRTLSPMEYEIINGWLSNQLSEELILGALKEATYNGVSSLRYIDRILLEWSKKGFKNMNDVNNFLEKKDNQNKARNEEKVLFDYNWLEDDE